jgi:hypothetical protein
MNTAMNFRAGIGAEALKEISAGIDLKKKKSKLRRRLCAKLLRKPSVRNSSSV